MAEPDRWSRWLSERRDGGSERRREMILDELAGIRDRILARAGPLEGATVLDVGTGEGLIGLEALERVGADGRVIFSDVSGALLEHTRDAVRARGALDRAAFVAAPAETLDPIADACADVVTVRSVLIYVADKAAAFAAIHRVLRPGGRLSLFEPISRLTFPEPTDRFWGYDVGPVAELADRVKAAFADLYDPVATVAMMGFDDRDLARLAEEAGFARVHLECHIDVEPGPSLRGVSPDTLLDSAPNPLAPTIREALDAALDGDERERMLAHLRREVVEGRPVRRSARAWLAAAKDP